MATNKPAITIRDGYIKATIWANNTENGEFYSVVFSRLYKDKDDKPQNASSFSNADLLKVQRLAAKAYDWILEQRIGAS